jgi:hypothetical protein
MKVNHLSRREGLGDYDCQSIISKREQKVIFSKEVYSQDECSKMIICRACDYRCSICRPRLVIRSACENNLGNLDGIFLSHTTLHL